MEANTTIESIEKTSGSVPHGMEVGRKVGSMGFPGIAALEGKMQEIGQAVDVRRSGSASTAVTSMENGPRFMSKIEPGTGAQKTVGAKVGTWILNPNTLKKLGIESSVMSALSKQRKAAAPNPAPIGSIVQIKSPPKPTTIALESSSKTASLNSRINSNFNKKILSKQPNKFQILSNVVLTEPIIDVSGKNLTPEIIKQSIVHIQQQKQPKNNFISNPTPVALIGQPPTLESRKLQSTNEQLTNIQPTAGPSRDAFVFKPKPVSLICSRITSLESPNRVIQASPNAQITEISEVIPANICSSLPQQPSTSSAYNAYQPVPRKSPPTITKDSIGIGVANASPPVLKLLNNKLRAKMDRQRSPTQVPDTVVPIRSYSNRKKQQKLEITEASSSTTILIDSETKLEPYGLTETSPLPIAFLNSIPMADQSPKIDSPIYKSLLVACESVKEESVSLQEPIYTSDDTKTCTQSVIDDHRYIASLSPAKTTATHVPKTQSSAFLNSIPMADQSPKIDSPIYKSLLVACESVKEESVSLQEPICTSDDTKTCTQSVIDDHRYIASLSPAKTTAAHVPKTQSSAPKPFIPPTSSPDLLGFRRQDLRYSGSLLKKFTEAHAGHKLEKPKNTRPTLKASIRPKRQYTYSTGSQTGDEPTAIISSLQNVDTTEEVLASSSKVLATMELDPDEADDEISDIESRKTTKINQVEKTSLEAPVQVEIKQTDLAPKPVAIAKGKYRRIKATPVPVVRKRGVAPASVDAVQATQVVAAIDLPARPTHSVDLNVVKETPPQLVLPLTLNKIANESETEIQIKTKKMQAMLMDRTSSQSHPKSAALPHKFTTPSNRPRTVVKHYTTSDDDSSEATHSRPQRPKRQFRKVTTSIDVAPPNTNEISEDYNINIEELNERSDVLVEQVEKCFTVRPEPSRRLESTSSATSDVENSFVKYLARLSASKERSELERDKYTEALVENQPVLSDIATIVPPKGEVISAQPESVQHYNSMDPPGLPASIEYSELQDDQRTEFDQTAEKEVLQPDISTAEATNKDETISELEPFKNVDWMTDSVGNYTSDVNFIESGLVNDVKSPIFMSRKQPRKSLVSLLAEHLDRDTLMSDILKAEYDRFILISSDDSSDDDKEVEVHKILGPVESIVPDDDEQNKASDDSTDFIIPIFDRDSGIVTEDNMEADLISVDPVASEIKYDITELVHKETAETSLPNYEIPVPDLPTEILNDSVQIDLVRDEPCLVGNELEAESISEFIEDDVNIKDERHVILMESEVQTTVEIATTGEDAEDISEQSAVDMAWSLGVSNQIQSTSYDPMLNSSTESVEERFVVYEPTSVEFDHGPWKESNAIPSQDAVEVSAVTDESEISDILVGATHHTNEKNVSGKSSKNLELLTVDSEKVQEKCLLDMGQQSSTITVDCEEQLTTNAAIGDLEVPNSVQDSSVVLQEVIQEELPEIKKSAKKKRISVKPHKVPRKKAKFVEEPPAEVDIQVESRPFSPIDPVAQNHSRVQKSPHIEESDDTFVPKKRSLSKDSDSSEDILMGRPNRSRAQIIDSDNEIADKTEIKNEAALAEPAILVEPKRPAPLPSKRKRTVKSYADFFIGDNQTHTDDTPPATRSRRSVNNVETDMVTPKHKRRRKSQVPESPTTTDEQSSNSMTEGHVEGKPTLKRVRQPRNAATLIASYEENITATTSSDEKLTPKRGRPSKTASTSPSDEQTTPKRSLGRKPTVKPTDPSLPPIVTCGNCKKEMESSKWNEHVAYHYGLAWLDGIETAVDMDINNSKANKIMSFMKVHKITSLKCHNCPDIKRSAIGYLSHLEVCGLTTEQRKEMMYQCPYCPSELRKVSIPSHNEYCSGLRQQRLQEKAEAQALLSVEGTDDKVETEDTFRPTMRQSAKKAIRSFKSIIEDFVEKPEDCIRRFNTITGLQYKNWSIELVEHGCMKCPEVDCDYQSSVRKEMSKHYKECIAKKDSRYYCGRCSAAPDTYSAMLDHVKSAHTLRKRRYDKIFDDSGSEAELGKESSDSDGPSGEEEVETDGDPQFNEDDDNGQKPKRLRTKLNPTIENGRDRLILETHAASLKGYSVNCFFKPAIEWTQDYREAHYFTTCAYPFALPVGIRVLNTDEAVPYLPTSQQSPQFCRQLVNNYNKTRMPKQWSLLDTFSSISNDDSYTIYCGGPVQLLEWLPLPDSYTDSQLLAIVCKRDASERIYNNPKQPSVCCTLQIWNIDRLQNPIFDRAGKVGGEPRLLYNVAYDEGPTMACAFCPSGGYTDDRLGLVALPTHDGDVRIMALPKNFTCDSSGLAPVLRLEPSLVLTSVRGRKVNEQISKIAWSKAKGHHIIVAGYVNGLVIVWRLNNMDSPLIRMEVDGVRTLLPVRVFYSGSETIKMIDMHHDMHGDTRWLVVGGHDHKVKFYDLQGSECEISVAQLKSRVTGGHWPLHWTSFISSIDDTYGLYTAGIGVRQPLDFGTRTMMINTSVGATNDITYSDWLHASIFVTGYGDIRVSYFQQFVSSFIEVQRRRKAILGYTDTVEINQVTTAEQTDASIPVPADASTTATSVATTSDDIQPVLDANTSQSSPNAEFVPASNTERGIVFYDLMTPVPSIYVQTTKQRTFPLPLVNSVRINKVTLNSNSNAYKWYAIGYELGFVRIKCLVPMTIPKQDGRSCR